ncbi:hypothetical protein CBER1_08821 [Cercospora berteroae]|uniref:Uncharacterized protein n=1 Tax=Cercospora berteroae TaxID=357750 RepID=A0A2S6BW00_9PEZI|nr:hypothetical protein CBER1_08821 [Cercospora berteroae]
MRNNIYELVYGNDTSEDNEIDLLNAEPPSNALILACRQIHDETTGIYRSSYREFWSQSTFSLPYAQLRNNYQRRLQRHRSEDLQHITQFQISMKAAALGALKSAPTIPVYYKLVRPNVWYAYTEIEGKKRIKRYWYHTAVRPGQHSWKMFDSEESLIMWLEAVPSSGRTDLVSQIGYFISGFPMTEALTPHE